jgi:hypothetical protein
LVEQPDEEFRKTDKWLNNRCKSCDKLYYRSYEARNKEKRNQKCRDFNKPYYEANKLKWRNNNLLLNYGISLDEFNQMRQEQNYSCKLCGKHEDLFDRGLYVDHCHDTGDVRGLLCVGCNAGLGMLGDNVEGLERAISYLKGELR